DLSNAWIGFALCSAVQGPYLSKNRWFPIHPITNTDRQAFNEVSMLFAYPFERRKGFSDLKDTLVFAQAGRGAKCLANALRDTLTKIEHPRSLDATSVHLKCRTDGLSVLMCSLLYATECGSLRGERRSDPPIERQTWEDIRSRPDR